MDCINPPPLTDQVLVAFVEQAADPSVETHLAQCGPCRERAAALATEFHTLRRRLFRAACPAALELGEYQVGLTSSGRTAAIQQHVQTCSHCTHELNQLNAFHQEVTAAGEPGLLLRMQSQIEILIAQLIDTLVGSSSRSPALAGLRGDTPQQWHYAAGDWQVILDVQPDPGQVGRSGILGLVLGPELSPSMTAQLWQADQLLATSQVDDLGNFIFSALTPGVYDLTLRAATVEIQIPALVV
jgi:hypothetical protein